MDIETTAAHVELEVELLNRCVARYQARLAMCPTRPRTFVCSDGHRWAEADLNQPKGES